MFDRTFVPSLDAGRRPARATPWRSWRDARRHVGSGPTPRYTPAAVDLPLMPADPALTSLLAAVFDQEGKVGRALDALGPVAGRDVVLLDGDGGRREADLTALGARVRAVETLDPARLPAEMADVVIACWTGLGLGPSAEPVILAGLQRVLRAEGRILLVEDYGRDDVRALYADPDREERLRSASDRRGPMFAAGFRLRTIHCFWTFPAAEDAGPLLAALFPITGPGVAAGLRRPRLEHKVAVFHRGRDG